jgi:hypothetical protein
LEVNATDMQFIGAGGRNDDYVSDSSRTVILTDRMLLRYWQHESIDSVG